MKKPKKPAVTESDHPSNDGGSGLEEVNPKSVSASELNTLRKRVKALEIENRELRLEITALRQQAQTQTRSPDEQRREQQHNYFKYSNARRY